MTLAAGCASTPEVKPAADSGDGGGLVAIEAAAHLAIEAAPTAGTTHFVLAGGTVMTATGKTFAPGWVEVRDGRIVALGEGAPAIVGVQTIDVAGKWVTPGLIDVHSHLGVYPAPSLKATNDGNEATSPTTPGVWAEHSFWAEDPNLQRAAEGGITALEILPGSANLIGGRGVTLHLRPMRGARAMRFPGAPDTLKMACGENPKRVYGDKGGAPSTRMGNVRGYREAFAGAARYLKDNGKKKKDDVPRDLGNETLAGLLEGRILAEVHCYTAQDMLSFLQVASEFGFKVRAFHHALEAYKIRDLLAANEVGVATWADWWGFKLEAWDAIPENAAMLASQGVKVAIHSDSEEGIQRLNQEAAKAMYSGRQAGFDISEDAALRWVTANPAWMLGIEGEVGTLETGKRADLVVWSASPFSVYAQAERVWVDGVPTVDRSEPKAPRVPWSDFESGLEIVP